MTGLYPCGVSAAIHTMLQAKGIECPHCRAIKEARAADPEVTP